MKEVANQEYLTERDDLTLIFEQALDGDYDASGEGLTHPVLVLSGEQLLSTQQHTLGATIKLHGLLSSFQLWLVFLSTVLECLIPFLATRMSQS